jgi:uncharacterized membrane protein (UPF0127 family)
MKRYLALGFCLIAVPAFAQDVDPENLLDFGGTEPLVIVSQSGEHAFDVEVADTLPKQRQGLMYREQLDADSGMLFEYDGPLVASIWMKNTPLPLDIIFVRANGRILKIEHNAQPYKLRSVSSEAPVTAVLELNGGRAEDLGILPGDVVRHEFFGTAE